MFEISLATADDIPDLCRLLAILFEQETEFAPDEVRQREGLRRIFDNPDVGTIFVARLSTGRVVGMVSLLYTVSTFLGAEVGLLEDVIVDPACRGEGVGSQLIDHALKHGEQRGCRRVTVLTDIGNEKAMAFYKRHGFGKSTMQPMRRHL